MSKLRDNNKLQAGRRVSQVPIVISWMRYFTARVTESGPKSRDHSISSLETAIVMLLYSRLKVLKMQLEMIFWLTVTAKRVLRRLCLKKKGFLFFLAHIGVAEWDWWKNIFKKETVFHFRDQDLSF